MKKSTRKDIRKYTAVFEPALEGGYVVYVPSLPGCVTQGETFEEAQMMVRDAIDGYIAVLKADEEAVPIERPGVVISEVYC
ncbi:MAG: Toxin-antitoxin system, antitoxin component, HicB family [Parcubacteria group bacterium GW2011_GWA2_47_8]|nr:MAG: Toxin-antitoxin system, antitoxin component, HicB family [Parcubacteria group bacterium GW2011_GWA2_47_8]OHB19679.1 MAG: hypothetical protein A2666_04040 [Parcubacteria group bacterium RIFCSPHIGHO2_01_FULL_47_10b]